MDLGGAASFGETDWWPGGFPLSQRRETAMKCNMGKGDRIFRGIVGIALLAVGYYFKSWWGLIGLIPLGTALVSFCPLYVPFRINTAGKSD
jgi:hypothetical protein